VVVYAKRKIDNELNWWCVEKKYVEWLQTQILNELNVPRALVSLYNVSNVSLKYDYMNNVGGIVNPCSNSIITQWLYNNGNLSL